MDNRHTLLALLQLMQTPGLGAKTLGKIIEETTRAGLELSEFVELTPVDMAQYVHLKTDVAENIRKTRQEAESVFNKLQENQIEVVVKGGNNYPEHLLRILGDTAPPVLFVEGSLNVLDHLAVSFCGSRNASERGLQIAADCAEALAHKDINVVSGYAHGVDLAAHRGALASGGVTTLVLAEGILHFRPKGEVSEYLADGNFLVVSEFPPRLPWSVHNAMQRNRTICGFADAMILVESGLSGGTFEAGNTSLRLNLPLFVVEYKEPPNSAEGNAHFLRRGAYALQSTENGKPSLGKLWKALDLPVEDLGNTEAQTLKAETLPGELPVQLSLPFFNLSVDAD